MGLSKCKGYIWTRAPKGAARFSRSRATTGTSLEIVLSMLMLQWCLPAFHGSRPLGLRSCSRNQARGGGVTWASEFPTASPPPTMSLGSAKRWLWDHWLRLGICLFDMGLTNVIQRREKKNCSQKIGVVCIVLIIS